MLVWDWETLWYAKVAAWLYSGPMAPRSNASCVRAVPGKYFSIAPKPPYHTLDREKFDAMISEFYRLRVWNGEGVPCKEELDRLGLDFVRRELEQRGIL